VNQEFQDTFVQNIVDLWINPEIQRRKEKNLLPQEFAFYAAQVIMNFDLPTEVRFNEEVRARVKGTFPGTFTKGQQIYIDQLESIEAIELTEIDPNAGHMTLLSHRGGWFISFNFQYNAARRRSHVAASKEFLDCATTSLERSHFRSFADNLFSAVELLAKATLLSHDEDMLTNKKHGRVHAKFNLWGKLGNRSYPGIISGR